MYINTFRVNFSPVLFFFRFFLEYLKVSTRFRVGIWESLKCSWKSGWFLISFPWSLFIQERKLPYLLYSRFHTPLILVLQRLRQGDVWEIQASLVYVARPCIKENKTKTEEKKNCRIRTIEDRVTSFTRLENHQSLIAWILLPHCICWWWWLVAFKTGSHLALLVLAFPT